MGYTRETEGGAEAILEFSKKYEKTVLVFWEHITA